MTSTNKTVQMALNAVACNGGQSKDKLLAIYKRELNKPGDKVEFKKVEKLPGGFETWYVELFAKWHDEDREDPFNRLERAINAGERVLYTAVEVRRKIANDGSVTANVQVSVRNVGNSVAANEKPYGPFDVKKLVRDAYKMTINTPPDELKKKWPNILRSMGGKARGDYVKRWGEAAVKKAEDDLRAGNSVAANGPTAMGADEAVRWAGERKAEIRKALMQINLVAGQTKGTAAYMLNLSSNLSGPAGAAAEKWAKAVKAACEGIERETAKLLG